MKLQKYIFSNGNTTEESGVEVKKTSETRAQIGGWLRFVRGQGKPVSSEDLPPATKTTEKTTVSGYTEIKNKKNNTTVITKATANQNEVKVEASVENNIKIKKIPLKSKTTVSISNKPQSNTSSS